MSTLASAVIAAGAAITAAIITAILNSRKNDKDLAIHDEKSNTRQSRLSGEHTLLSKHIVGLSGEHKIITNHIVDAAKDLRVLREEQIKSHERQRALTSQQLDIKQTVDHIVALTAELSRVQQENGELRQRCAQLEQSIAKIQAQQERRTGLRRDTDWEMEP